MLSIEALTAALTPPTSVAAPKKSRVLSIEALSAALDCATVDHCDSENSQTPESRLDATATMLETRVLEQCEPIELALGLLSAPSRPEESATRDDNALHAQRVIFEALSSVEGRELFAKLLAPTEASAAGASAASTTAAASTAPPLESNRSRGRQILGSASFNWAAVAEMSTTRLATSCLSPAAERPSGPPPSASAPGAAVEETFGAACVLMEPMETGEVLAPAGLSEPNWADGEPNWAGYAPSCCNWSRPTRTATCSATARAV